MRDLELDKSISPDEIKLKMKPFINELHLKFTNIPREDVNVNVKGEDGGKEVRKEPEAFNMKREERIAIDRLNSIFAIKRL